ncbi:Fur family transcriptional regulator [Chloroflexota bacterium]
MSKNKQSLKVKRRDLSKDGVRVTSQRELILEIIRRGKGHLDADEVYRQARAEQHNISLSTVYRNLQLFKRLGLVEEVHFDTTHHHYEMKPSSEHYHMVCLGCGRVVEFSCPLSRYVKRNVAEAGDFEITDIKAQVSGYCSRCRQGNK